MSRIVRVIRKGNEAPFAEGNEGTVFDDGYFSIRDTVFQDLKTGDLVKSFWTGRMIVPDGKGPKWKDATGQFAIMTKVFESDTVSNGASVVDATVNFTASDYGFKDDFGTDIPDPT